MGAITRVRIPRRNRRNAVPQPPDEQIGTIFVARHHVAQQIAAVVLPGRVVVAMQHAPLRIRRAIAGAMRLTVAVYGANIRMFAGQPFGTSAVCRQRNVQPHVQTVLLGQVKEQIKIAQLVLPGARFHPIPIAKTAYDAQARRANAGKIVVPHFLFRNGRAVVFNPNWKGGLGMFEKIYFSHNSPPQSTIWPPAPTPNSATSAPGDNV